VYQSSVRGNLFVEEKSMLISGEQLAKTTDVRIVDLRWPRGREKYEQGHIPGAVFVDLDKDLSSSGGPGRHPLPAEAQFAQVLSRLGIGPDTKVVIYDDVGGSIAARFWFLLRASGHEKVSLLDGGLQSWTGPLSKEEAQIAPSPLREVRFDRSRFVDRDQVRERGAVPLLDARAPERYRGEVEPLDKRAGHIPGAHNAPWSQNLDAQTGRFKPPPALRDLYKMYEAPIVSCGSGVTACHDAFAMELAGLPLPRLYVGSWSDWSSDPSRPIATGAAPG
jgi:thiosulfate/3-mercaptopyruvate sulfurtransferase